MNVVVTGVGPSVLTLRCIQKLVAKAFVFKGAGLGVLLFLSLRLQEFLVLELRSSVTLA